MTRPSMKEVREETVRQAWDMTLKNPEKYPDALRHFPHFSRIAVAEKLRKKRKGWRSANGFQKGFFKEIIYRYGEDEEVEVTKCQ